MIQDTVEVKVPMHKPLALPARLSISEWNYCFKRAYDRTRSPIFKAEYERCCNLIKCGIECNAKFLSVTRVKNDLFFAFDFITQEDLEEFCNKYPVIIN